MAGVKDLSRAAPEKHICYLLGSQLKFGVIPTIVLELTKYDLLVIWRRGPNKNAYFIGLICSNDNFAQQSYVTIHYKVLWTPRFVRITTISDHTCIWKMRLIPGTKTRRAWTKHEGQRPLRWSHGSISPTWTPV